MKCIEHRRSLLTETVTCRLLYYVSCVERFSQGEDGRREQVDLQVAGVPAALGAGRRAHLALIEAAVVVEGARRARLQGAAECIYGSRVEHSGSTDRKDNCSGKSALCRAAAAVNPARARRRRCRRRPCGHALQHS
jgi:hypothetical protein